MIRRMTAFYLFSHELSESLYKLQGSVCRVQSREAKMRNRDGKRER